MPYALSNDPFVWLIWILGFLVFGLLVLPAFYFWVFGWSNRKSQILDYFTGAGAVYYLQRFHRLQLGAHFSEIEAVERTRKELTLAISQKQEAVQQIENLPPAPNPEEAKRRSDQVEESQRSIQEDEGKLKAVEHQLATARDGALAALKAYYRTQFGRSRFILPFVLLLAIAGCLLSACAISALGWHETGTWDKPLSLTIVLAMLGGYTWVVFDLIDRARRDDLTPTDFLWSSFRLVVAVPIGYTFGKLFNEALALPMAYLLGTLPTGTLMTIGRRAAAKWAQLSDAGEQAQTEIQRLVSVDIRMAERFADEGITSIIELAYADPARLSIRTGLNFGAVLSSAGEALLAIYITEKQQLGTMRKYGLAGCYECACLWDDLTSRDPTRNAFATTIIDNLARDLGAGFTKEGLQNILYQVAMDPYTQFQVEVWT